MKKTFQTMLWGVLCTFAASGQPFDLTLNNPENGTQLHQAYNSITFSAGYSYSPAGGSMLAEILRNPINGNISYSSPVNADTYSVNKNLAVGKIPGHLFVAGSAAYSIPIEIPAGTNGLNPSISLNYSSGFTDGIMGIGWNIGGISAITRTKKTIYNDGKSDAIRGDLTDKYALDGKRLVVLNGYPYGEDNSIYGTEHEEFSKIISKGSSGTNQGPEYFIVYTKSGLICEYGNSADSKLKNGTCIITWKLNKITDRHNNYIRFSYIDTDDELPVDKIEYTGHGTSQNPFAQILFNYKTRADMSSYVYAGKEFSRDLLLDNIEVRCNGQLFKKYVLEYMRDTFAQLQKVTQYSSQNIAFNPTVFTWTDQTESFTQNANYSSSMDELLYTGDFNGDGRDDLVTVPVKSSYSSSDKWKLYLADAGGNLSNVTAQGILNVSFEAFMVNDFDGDGLTDLMMQEKHPDSTYPDKKHYYFYKSLGTDFSRSATFYLCYNDNTSDVVDYDGDGKLEFMFHNPNNAWFLYTYSGVYIYSGTIPSFGKYWVIDNGMHNRILDFNGDGCSDLLTLDRDGYKVYEFKGTNNVLIETYSGTNMDNNDFLLFGDYNGDGKMDIIKSDGSEAGSNWIMLLLTSSGFQAHTITAFNNFDIGQNNNRIYARDMDADGRTDVILVGRGTNNSNSYNRINVALSTGGGFNITEHIASTAMAWITNDPYDTYGRFYNFGDFNGDGRYQLLYKCYNTSKLFSFASGTPGHLVGSVIDGLGAKSTLSYLPMSNSSVYTRGTGAAYPVNDFASSMQLVSQVVTDDGIGGTSSVAYRYEGAKIHRQGKGFLGFARLTSTDGTACLLTQTLSAFDSTYFYPQVKKVTKKATNCTTTEADDITIETTTYTWKQTILDAAAKRIFPYISSSTQSNDLTGHSVTTATNSVDSYGNPTQVVRTFNNGVTETSVNNYTTWLSTSDWLVGRIGSSTVTYSKNGETSVSKAVRFTYSSDGIVKPDLIYYYEGTPLAYATNNDYDNKGNLVQVFMNGNSIGESHTNYTYDSNGVRILTLTDALGHVTSRVYDPALDRLTSENDYLGNVTAFQYDSSDRPRSITSPAGSQVSTTYVWSGTNKPSLAVYGVTQSGNDGSMETTWYDILGRAIRSEKKGFGGSMILTDTQYNEKGQVYRISDPYFAGGSPVWAQTYAAYDDYGRITTINRNTGRNTSYSYNSATVTETTAGKTSSKTYGPDGTLTSASDNGGTIYYAYFPDGKAKSITAPGGVITTMQYADAARNQTQLVDPSAGTINYTYNALGQIKTQTNARNQLTSWNYLADGRINTVVTPEGTTTYTYNSNKQLTGINAPNNVSRSFGYDNKGRVNSVDETIAGTNFSTNFTFDSYGRVNTRTHPSGIVETWEYNGNGFLATISAGGSTRYTVTSMNAREQLTGATYGSNLAATFGVDSYGYPNISSAGSIQDYRYAFNPVTGNLNSRQNFKRSLYESFSYTDNQDNLDRLTSVAGPRNLAMTYAANGNILTKSDISSSSAFTYGESTRPYALTGVTSSAGVIPAINQTATYTASEKVNTLNEDTCFASFVYNSQNQRAKMEVSQNGANILTRWYAGSSYMKETAGGITKEFTYIGGDAYTAPVAAVTQAGTTTYYYLLRDYLGNITHLVNTANQVVAEYNFDAWGRRRSADDWSYTLDQNDLELFAGRGFTAHESLPWFNLVNMNGRLYDPLVGRFLSPDPFVQIPDYTQNLNRYSYCVNNPLKYTDPSGEIVWFVPILIGAAIFGTGNLAAHAIKGDVNSFGDGLKYFGQGALVGAALGAAWQFAPLIPGIGQGIQTGMNIYGAVHLGGAAVSTVSGLGQGIFTGDWNALGNAGKIFLGNFNLDENRSFFGGVWQGVSRHTWEFIQTGLGHSIGQLRNTFGGIDDVDYFGGATLMNSDDNSGEMWGFTLGSFINSKNLDVEDEMFRHEYGHTLQGQRWGVLYPFAIGIPSAISSNFSSNEKHRNRWYEKGANRYGERYYRKYLPNNLTLTPWDDIRYPRH